MTTRVKGRLRRVNYLRNRYGTDIAAIAREQDVSPRLTRTPAAAFDYLIAFDPTPKAIYLRSVVKWMLSGAIRFEDARIVRDTLARYDSDKHRLPVEQRDIGKFPAPGDIARVLDGDAAVAVRDIPADVLAQSELVDHGADWSVFKVTGIDAAVWWGDSTQWCTRHRDSAATYLDVGPLYVLQSKTEKFQFHLEMGQVMDRYDKPPGAMDGIPEEAVTAALRIARGDRENAEFYPAVVAGLLQSVLLRRAGKPSGPEFTYQGARPRWKMRGTHWSVHAEFAFAPFDVSIRNRLAEPSGDGNPMPWQLLTSDVDFGKLDLEHRRVAERFLVYAIRSAAGDRPNDGVYQVPKKSPLGVLGNDTAWVVSSGGRLIAVWQTRDDNRPFVRVLEVTGNGVAGPFDLRTREQVAGLQSHLLEAVRQVHDQFPPRFRVLAWVGSGILSEAARRTWAESRDRELCLVQLGHKIYDDADPVSLRQIFDLIIPDEKTAVTVRNKFDPTTGTDVSARMLWLRERTPPEAERIFQYREAVNKARIQATFPRLGRPDVDVVLPPAPTASDLLALKDIPGMGEHLALLPDEECTPELIDELLQAGRADAIAHMPASLVTPERVKLAMQGDELPVAVRFSQRTISYRTLKALSAAKAPVFIIAALEPLLTKVHKQVSNTLASDIAASTLFKKACWGQMEVFLKAAAQDPHAMQRLRLRLKQFPLDAWPWPAAVEAVRHDPDLVSAVIEHALDYRIGDPDVILPALLKHAPELAEAIETAMAPMEYDEAEPASWALSP